MVEHSALARISEAKSLLANASLPQAKEIRDKAEALRMYMKAAGESLEAQNHAAEVKIRAERKAGEILSATNKSMGAASKRGDIVSPRLEDIGVSKKQSQRWQRVASIPEDVFEDHLETTKARHEELTQASCLRLYSSLNAVKKTKQDVQEQHVSEMSITDALDLFNESILDLWETWPEEHAAVFVKKLRSAADEIESTGGLRK